MRRFIKLIFKTTNESQVFILGKLTLNKRKIGTAARQQRKL